MPIYEYRCQQCSHEFELLLKSARQAPESTCPSCGSRDVTQRLSVFAAGPRSSDSSMPVGAGCGRCGDPSGPCGL